MSYKPGPEQFAERVAWLRRVLGCSKPYTCRWHSAMLNSQPSAWADWMDEYPEEMSR